MNSITPEHIQKALGSLAREDGSQSAWIEQGMTQEGVSELAARAQDTLSRSSLNPDRPRGR